MLKFNVSLRELRRFLETSKYSFPGNISSRLAPVGAVWGARVVRTVLTHDISRGTFARKAERRPTLVALSTDALYSFLLVENGVTDL